MRWFGLPALALAAVPAIVAVLAGASGAGTAAVKTIVVTSTLDGVETTPGNGICTAKIGDKLAAPGKSCTLRAAIQTANAKRGTYLILLPEGTLTLTLAGKSEDKAAKGDLDVTTANLTLAGKGPAKTTINGAGVDRVLDVAGFSQLTVKNLRITGGAAPGSYGGGIRVAGGLTLEAVVLESNHAVDTAEGTDGYGGALEVEKNASAKLSRVTFRTNVAKTGAGLSVRGRAELTNVTFSGNNASVAGGGIAILGGDVSLVHTTVYGNTAAQATAIYTGGAMKLAIRGSIVAGSCTSAPSWPGGNVVTDKKCGAADKVAPNPGLAALAAGGNGVPVHPLTAASPAIDFAPSDTCPKVDARGVARPQGKGCDAGAYERTAAS